MKLGEALKIINGADVAGAVSPRVYLATGIMPLHLETFFRAHLIQRAGAGVSPDILTGVYDDLAGNVILAAESDCDAAAVVIEWSDLDPRLGLRRLGGWGPNQLPDIVECVKNSAARLESLLADSALKKTVAVVLPTLTLPPVDFSNSDRAGTFELQLADAISQLSLRLVRDHGCRLVNPQQLNTLSPPDQRYDVKADFHAGFPYAISHASAVGDMLARLVRPSPPKKGLITDLDDTLWQGILGEVGVDGVSWDLDNHSQIHGLYQQLLAALADAGTLIAVASKNELSLVMQGFEREDILLPKDKVFPIEANWGRKSESIHRILRQWNIGPESVVFVDDSLMEVAEVAAGHPQIECHHFPKGDDQACYRLLQQLRDHFPKERLSEEDTLRRESLRQGQAVAQARDSGESFDVFLEGLNAELSFDWTMPPTDGRAFELINKTNQFNLTGRRIEDNAWREMMLDKNRRLLVVSYQDKFGRLGKIAALGGTISSGVMNIDTWVMSCRAFSRRIEYACLQEVFRNLDVDVVSFDFTKTPRNGPVQEFLAALGAKTPTGRVQVSEQEFSARCPRLFNSTKDN